MRAANRMESAANTVIEIDCYRLCHKSLKLPDMPHLALAEEIFHPRFLERTAHQRGAKAVH